MINGSIVDTNMVSRFSFDFENNTVIIHMEDNTAVSVTWKEFQTMEIV